MNKTLQQNEQNETLKLKLHPRRFPGMSGRMAAIVGFVVGEPYTRPAIDDIVITSDGFVLAQRDGDCGNNDIIGTVSDLRNNWTNLLNAAELTDTERQEAQAAFDSKIRSFSIA